jgi:hypothetical protein
MAAMETSACRSSGTRGKALAGRVIFGGDGEEFDLTRSE